MMLTAGVDLAAEPKKTGVATIEWTADRAFVRELRLGATDADIINLVRESHKTGIDCPLGWPESFVDFVSAHHAGHSHEALELSNAAWRRRLTRRETDEAVYSITGKVALSVSTDRIGVTALRCARLLSAMAADKISVDRSGVDGAVVEVYPSASLRCWIGDMSLSTIPYKGKANIGGLTKLAGYMQEVLPWLDLGEYRELFWKSDDAFDAVLCALTARAVNTGNFAKPSTSQRDIGRCEGWIALPTGNIQALITT